MSFILRRHSQIRAFSIKPSVTQSAKDIVNSILHGNVKAEDLNASYNKFMAKKDSINELVIHDVKPEAFDDYTELIQEHYKRIALDPSFPCKLFGSWETQVGQLDQAVHVWQYQSYDDLNTFHDQLKKDPHNQAFKKLLKPMLRSRKSQIVLEFEFWNPTTPYDLNSIYELRSYLLKPGMMLEWEQGWRIGLEARRQHVQPIGAWFSQLGDLNYVHHMWAYPSLQYRKDKRDETWKEKGWGESVKKTVHLIDHMESRILKPLVLTTQPGP
ncbi:hypothetical protein HDV02_001188 [Globomyces sp. JEL0801]|nr:hypothetical protein HDV02_001188 [Globomyces sp. JEL0801]